MSYTSDHRQKFADLNSQIENQSHLRRQANGGNSILFSYPSKEEHLYISKARDIYAERAAFIDISKLLVAFIDQDGWDEFRAYYLDFKDTPHVIFKSDDPSIDLFDMIIDAIENASKSKQIPFLVRTGCLLGTGIENVNIMEDKVVMTLPDPLVIFYPSRFEDDNLYFLDFKPASKYRCTLVK